MRCFRRWALAGLASILVGTSASAENASLRVLAFNVLAPIWAGEKWYPEVADLTLLDRTARRGRTVELLQALRDQIDVACLQEVNAAELPHYLAALGPAFEGYLAQNDPDFWSSYLVPEIPWEPNGPAVIWRRASLENGAFTDVPVSVAGNHVAALEARAASNGGWVRVFSVHLDSDRQDNRIEELRTLLSAYPAQDGVTDVICGDINEDTVTGTAAGILRRAGYVDVLGVLGNREATHPWSSGYYRARRWAIIDHVLVRGGQPLSGDVLDFGLGAIEDESERIEANLRVTGSDHYPLSATIGLPAPGGTAAHAAPAAGP